jgi:hypothetical protein
MSSKTIRMRTCPVPSCEMFSSLFLSINNQECSFSKYRIKEYEREKQGKSSYFLIFWDICLIPILH